MKKQEEALYNFLTEEENFSTMLDIVDNKFEFVRKKLLEDFWVSCKNELDKLNEKADKKWEIGMSDNIFERWSQLWIYKKKWLYETKSELVPITVVFESLTQDLHFGVWLDADNNKKWNVENVKNYFQGTEISKTYKTGLTWWALRKDHEINFSNNKYLSEITPLNRESKVKELAQTLFDLANDLEQELEEMYNMKKK